jgi:hypothetical protein
VAYGWETPRSCDDYDYSWGSAFYATGLYDTEHILEWSVITDFFTQVNGMYSDDAFLHPDPDQNHLKIGFCKYWKESWDMKGTMENPSPQFNLKSSIKQRTPIEWIAAHYPYKQANAGGEEFMDELVLLQKEINSPAKNNVRRVLFQPIPSFFD